MENNIVASRSSDGQPCTQAGVVVELAKISRARAKFTTTTASVYGGARSAPPYTQAVLVVDFAWAREVFANFATTPAWVHGRPSLLLETTGVATVVVLGRFSVKIRK